MSPGAGRRRASAIWSASRTSAERLRDIPDTPARTHHLNRLATGTPPETQASCSASMNTILSRLANASRPVSIKAGEVHSWTGCATSNPTPNCARARPRSHPGSGREPGRRPSPAPQAARPARPPQGPLRHGRPQIRRRALEQEVERIGPPVDPDIARVEALLDDFARFWEIEEKPAERHKLLGQLFDRIWQHGGQIVAVTPRKPFARYFQAADDAGCLKRERRDSNPRPLA
jgi:hypothetical protein